MADRLLYGDLKSVKINNAKDSGLCLRADDRQGRGPGCWMAALGWTEEEFPTDEACVILS